jgi:serine/threonine protein kinase
MKLPSRYEHDAASAGGGMGDIHLCRDTHLNRQVVLKMLKDGGEGRRLLHEQLALSKLRSKHVVQLYDIIQVEQDAITKNALVLEYINGQDLKMESFAPDRTYLKTLWQIACGLVEIHQENIIHRDIKPQNMRMDADGIVKILDFGLARSSGIEAKTRNVIGTPGFMAPELWKTEEISFDQAIDVYAFGITALVLISKDIPRPLLEHPPQPLAPGALGGRAGIPDDVMNVIARCLSYEAVNRPPMSEVELILRRHLLHGEHRALVVLKQHVHEINRQHPKATAKSGDLGTIGIAYDGLKFKISSLTGIVAINNVDMKEGDELPDCCVIAFGPKPSRVFATFDVSNPEVMP